MQQNDWSASSFAPPSTQTDPPASKGFFSQFSSVTGGIANLWKSTPAEEPSPPENQNRSPSPTDNDFTNDVEGFFSGSDLKQQSNALQAPQQHTYPQSPQSAMAHHPHGQGQSQPTGSYPGYHPQQVNQTPHTTQPEANKSSAASSLLLGAFSLFSSSNSNAAGQDGASSGTGAPSALFSDPMNQQLASIAVEQGRNIIARQTRGWFSFLSFDPLKPYFAIDHQYIFHRFFHLLFPFRIQQYQRRLHNISQQHIQQWQLQKQQQQLGLAPAPLQGGGPDPTSDETILEHAVAYQFTEFELPVRDPIAPDLYIPMMSLITFILLPAYISGLTRGTMDPEQLASTGSTLFFLSLVELCIVKITMMNFSISGLSVMDILSYLSSKFWGYLASYLIAITFASHLAFYAVLLYCVSAHCWFVFMVFRNNMNMATDEQDEGGIGEYDQFSQSFAQQPQDFQLDANAPQQGGYPPVDQPLLPPQHMQSEYDFSPTPEDMVSAPNTVPSSSSNFFQTASSATSAALGGFLRQTTKVIQVPKLNKRMKTLLAVIVIVQLVFSLIACINMPIPKQSIIGSLTSGVSLFSGSSGTLSPTETPYGGGDPGDDVRTVVIDDPLDDEVDLDQ